MKMFKPLLINISMVKIVETHGQVSNLLYQTCIELKEKDSTQVSK